MGRQVAEVAHDLNNILCAVLGFCDLHAQEPAAASSARENIDDALRAQRAVGSSWKEFSR